MAIDLAGGDATKGGEIGDEFTADDRSRLRAVWPAGVLGITGWRDDFDQAIAMAKTGEAVTRGGVMYYTHIVAIMHGVVLPT